MESLVTALILVFFVSTVVVNTQETRLYYFGSPGVYTLKAEDYQNATVLDFQVKRGDSAVNATIFSHLETFTITVSACHQVGDNEFITFSSIQSRYNHLISQGTNCNDGRGAVFVRFSNVEEGSQLFGLKIANSVIKIVVVTMIIIYGVIGTIIIIATLLVQVSRESLLEHYHNDIHMVLVDEQK